MTVVIRLLDRSEAITWQDKDSETEMWRYSYELRESGALLVHARSRAPDPSGHMQEKDQVEVVYGPSAWAEVRGDH
ncbi:hypothetical protein ACFYPT_40315 [Streptomyces sp. NPDC005529]|uniref:hypothetical protein n=1 Tax=unclassified Streptomyces TaxID=2593676 RepID=UPI0033A58CE6